MPFEAGLLKKDEESCFKLNCELLYFSFFNNIGPSIQANNVVPISKPIVRLIVFVGKIAIAIGMPRNDVFPIIPPSCNE